jgi:hypothetical protein
VSTGTAAMPLCSANSMCVQGYMQCPFVSQFFTYTTTKAIPFCIDRSASVGSEMCPCWTQNACTEWQQMCLAV